MRFLPAILFLSLAGATTSAEPVAGSPNPPPYPFWDGSESIEQYAQRVHLPVTKTLDLGGGVTMEFVLIPAGTFTMGTPEPKPVDDLHFLTQVQVGVIAVGIGGSVLSVLLVLVMGRTIRLRKRPQWSLAWLVVLVLGTAVVLLGGMHWYYSELTLADAQNEYFSALARFKSSYDWQKPAHDVTLTKPYYMGKFEITQEQYQQIMGNNPSQFKGRVLPVEMVLWEDAQEFCKKASEKTGSVVRLPTDAEWERACRAGTRTTYYTGDAETDLDRAGWYDKNSKGTTHPVGQKAPNALGAYDMHGNVWEWCTDLFETYKADAVVDPQGPTEGHYRVLRGGTWSGDLGNCRSAFRNFSSPGNRGSRIIGVGFRVVVAPRTP